MHRSCTSKARWESLLRLQLAPVPLYFTVSYWSASEPLACLKQTFHQGIPGLLSVSSAHASTYLRLPGLLAPTLARSLSLSHHSIALPSSVIHSFFLSGFAHSISYTTPLCFYPQVSMHALTKTSVPHSPCLPLSRSVFLSSPMLRTLNIHDQSLFLFSRPPAYVAPGITPFCVCHTVCTWRYT